MRSASEGAASAGRHLLVAALLCTAWCGAALYATRAVQPLPPDAAHAATVARNLVRGLGNTIDWVPYHFGLGDQIRRVPEWHGVLRAPLLAGLFFLFGVHDDLVRIPGLVYSAATGLVAFAFARSAFGTVAGWLACLITLSSAALLFYGWIGTDDTGFAFFFLATIYLCYLGLTRDARHLRWAGWVGGLALLEKQTGLYLSVVFVVVLWLGRDRGVGIARTAVRLFGPFALAFSVYLLRNYAAHGGLMFQLGPLNWIYKARGAAAIFRLYDPPPTLADVLGQLGPAGVASIVLAQLQQLLGLVVAPAIDGLPWPKSGIGGLGLLALGIPSLAIHLRRDPTFVWISAAAVLGAVAFICGLYSVEPRYFLMLVPLSAISLAGAITRAWEGIGCGTLRRALRGGAVVAGLFVLVYAAAFAGRMGALPAPAADNRETCGAVVDWVRRNVPPDAVVLTTSPWLTSWATERLTVVAPTGRPGDLHRVARHYRTTWAFLPRWPARRQRRIREALLHAPLDLRAKRAFARDGCEVWRLRWHAAPES